MSYPFSKPPEGALDRTRVGYLVKGRCLCDPCTLTEELVHPVAVRLYLINLWPYSQTCHECGILMVDGLRNAEGPQSLFEVKTHASAIAERVPT